MPIGLLYTCESVEKHFQHKLAETNPCIISCGVEFPRDFPWPSFSLPFSLLLPSNMAANTNHTTLLKNQSAIKYLP